MPHTHTLTQRCEGTTTTKKPATKQKKNWSEVARENAYCPATDKYKSIKINETISSIKPLVRKYHNIYMKCCVLFLRAKSTPVHTEPGSMRWLCGLWNGAERKRFAWREKIWWREANERQNKIYTQHHKNIYPNRKQMLSSVLIAVWMVIRLYAAGQ